MMARQASSLAYRELLFRVQKCDSQVIETAVARLSSPGHSNGRLWLWRASSSRRRCCRRQPMGGAVIFAPALSTWEIAKGILVILLAAMVVVLIGIGEIACR